MTNHTPGATRAAEAIVSAYNSTGSEHPMNLKALADLIDRQTSAPDLLAALQEMYSMFKANADYSDDDKAAVEQAREAISKAEGST